MTDERRDDEILGRALSRAIETMDVNQTPFERSRIATVPTKRRFFPIWQVATASAAIVLALAIGSWLTRPTEGQPGVAASPTTPPASPSAAGPSPTANPIVATSVPTWVYFPRDGLPPVGASVPGYPPNSSSREIAIDTRISALRRLGPGEIPAGTTNPLSSVAPPQAGTSRFGVSVRIEGDLATVEFDLSSGWGVRGSAQSQALLQQLVYTITEEPGIRRALITEMGKPNAVIDQLVVDRPLTREDVFGYGAASRDSIAGGVGNSGQLPTLTAQWSVDSLSPGLARFVITVDPANATAALPLFRVEVAQNDEANKPEGGKWRFTVTVSDGLDQTTHAIVDRSPLRAVGAYPSKGDGRSVIYELGLDDLRPWRVFTLTNPTRIVLDIGGSPRAVSDRIAIYRAQPVAATPICSTTCDIQLSGAARVFEANVVWRVKDSAGKVIANGHFLASLGSSAVWGTFDTSIQVPPTFTGNGTLEVFEASPKDGSEQGLAQIPLTIR